MSISHSDTLEISGSRPETRFGDASPDVVEILSIHKMGKVQSPFGFPDTPGVRIVNNTPRVGNDFRVSSINTEISSFVFETVCPASTAFTSVDLRLPTLREPHEDIAIVEALHGAIDASNASLVDNDAFNFITG